jgi:hypothetical protein
MFQDIDLKEQGTEVFSLLRVSDLGADKYLDRFFDTGFEHQQKPSTEPGTVVNASAASKTSKSQLDD